MLEDVIKAALKVADRDPPRLLEVMRIVREAGDDNHACLSRLTAWIEAQNKLSGRIRSSGDGTWIQRNGELRFYKNANAADVFDSLVAEAGEPKE